jgi:hypothetical protein
MTIEWWLAFAERAGAAAAVLELGALIWMNRDRNRLLDSLKAKDVLIAEKDKQVLSLSERTLVLLAEIKTFMFHGGRPA